MSEILSISKTKRAHDAIKKMYQEDKIWKKDYFSSQECGMDSVRFT